MNRYARILLTSAMGVLIAAIGGVVMGDLAATPLPDGYYPWFEEHLNIHVGLVLTSTIQQILAYGLLLFLAAYLVTRSMFLAPWMGVACLLAGFWLYATVGMAWLYGIPARNVMPTLTWYMAVPVVVHAAALAGGAWIGARSAAEPRKQSVG